MNATERNKKCLFLTYILITVRKKDMTIKPAQNVFYSRPKNGILSGIMMSGISRHTDVRLCIWHPDGCICL